MKLTIHRGANEVGGNCVEVAHKGTRLVLDLGLPLFNEDRQPTDSFRLRKMTLAELQLEGVLPPVRGLFGMDDVPAGRPDAILLSHGHLDHTGLVDYSHPSIPIYASRGTSKMMLAGKLFARQPELPRERFRALTPGEPVTIGDFSVTGFGVDHSIHGAMGILVEAGGESLFYTGDVRMHGLHHLAMSRLLSQLRRRQIDTLLVEGTHYGLPTTNPCTELHVESRIDQLVADADGLVLACLSPQHVDRLTAFYRAAQSSGRTMAVDLYTAFVMHLAASETDLPAPTRENGVRVFVPATFTSGGRHQRYAKLLQRYGKNEISIQEVLTEPKKYVCTFRESMLTPDFGGNLPAGTLCLYGKWTGYLESESWSPVSDALEGSGGRVEVVHSTGHLLEEDIKRFVRAVGAKRVMPIHTFRPDRIRTLVVVNNP